jgi:5-methylcytosine-specific restriction endonuclease McrA
MLNYKIYLQTAHWQKTRKRKLSQAKYRCQVCYSQKKLHVHHRTYKRIGKEWLIDLTVLCEDCHDLFHKHSKLKWY